MEQMDLFAAPHELPEGFIYLPEFISVTDETRLVARIEQLDLREFHMRGVPAKRRVAHFGWGYEFDSFKLGPAPAIPDFLFGLRHRLPELAPDVPPADFVEVLVTEYPAGAGIGWHRDAPPFDLVVGVSLLAPCTMQFRRWSAPNSRGESRPKPLRQTLAPRSAYLLSGPARTAWEHHIPPIEHLRYSITFRTLRKTQDTRIPS